MKSGNSKLLILVALLVVVGAAILFLPTGATEEVVTEEVVETEEVKGDGNIIKADDSMPEFSIKLTNGETITPESLRGKVVLVNFWATWCPPCQEELKRVQADIIERFAGRDFVFLPISRGEELATVEKFLADNGYTFAVGVDTDQSVYNLFASEYIPRNYLVNRHGVVVDATVGYEAEEFEKLLQTVEMTLNAR